MFRSENQGCAEWGVAAADPRNPEDPPVYVRQPGDQQWGVALPEYPLWHDTAVTSRWFAAPGKLLRMDGRGPYCWLIAAGQTHDDLKSIRTAIPGQW